MAKGEQTRQRIIELAAPVFNERGYAGSSMSDIMEATGLEKGGIYRHFESKEALAAEALRFALSQSRRLRTDDLELLPSAHAKLRSMIHRFVHEPSQIKGGCPLLNAAVDADDGNALLRRIVRRAFEDWRGYLAGVVRQGIASGEFRSDARPDQVADVVISTLEGALVLHRIKASGEVFQNVSEALFAYADGLLAGRRS